MSATTTRAPSKAKRSAASRPIPPAAPVITATLPSSLPMSRDLRGEEHRLDLRVALEGMHAELAAEARLLEAAEGGRDAYRGVRVDRQDAGLERAGDAEGAAAVPRPDRAGEPVGRVVRDPHGLLLVLERDDGGDRTEHLFARDPVVVGRLDERAREPEALPFRRFAPEQDRGAVDVRCDRRAVLRADQRAHLGLGALGISDLDPARRLNELIHKAVVDRSLDEDAAARAAVLACVVEDGVR